MTIQEAIKSGKPFKREKDPYNIYYIVKNNRLYDSYEDWSEDEMKLRWTEPEYSGFEHLNAEDILADDWIVLLSSLEYVEKWGYE